MSERFVQETEPELPSVEARAERISAELNVEKEKAKDILQYELAGRNTANFCRHLSAQEKKPVLAINNPRAGSFLQIGFEHWLQNFGNEDEAIDFLVELQKNEEYASSLAQLKIIAEDLKELLSKTSEFFKRNFDFNTVSKYEDPSIDLRVEVAVGDWNVAEKTVEEDRLAHIHVKAINDRDRSS